MVSIAFLSRITSLAARHPGRNRSDGPDAMRHPASADFDEFVIYEM
jgi:hypothetical protein